MSAQDEVLDTRAVFLRDLILRGASVARDRNVGLYRAVLDQIEAAASGCGATRAILHHQWQAVREVLQHSPTHTAALAAAGLARRLPPVPVLPGQRPAIKVLDTARIQLLRAGVAFSHPDWAGVDAHPVA